MNMLSILREELYPASSWKGSEMNFTLEVLGKRNGVGFLLDQ